MAVTYLILAHQMPDQVGRLARRLSHADDRVVIHVDRKSELGPFKAAVEARPGPGEICFLEPRLRSRWGSFALVEAVLEGARAALKSGKPFSHLVLLTGQDYPIRPTSEIRQFLAENEQRSFLSWSTADDGDEPWISDLHLERLQRRHFRVPGRPVPVGFPNRFAPWVPLRSIPDGLPAVQGLAYWCLSREAIAYVVDFLERRRDVTRFFKRTLIADENLFQMVLLGSLRASLVNDDLHFVRWFDGWHPKTLVMEDLPAMLASTDLFARKFDMRVDSQVLDALDES